MNSVFMFFVAALGFGIAIFVYKKGDKPILGLIVGIMSLALVWVGFTGYQEIKKDAGIYRPLAIEWLEEQDNQSKIQTDNYNIYCIYFSPDRFVSVVYVELPASKDDIVMTFKRSAKALDGVHIINKDRKPLPDLNNRINPAIYFYE